MFFWYLHTHYLYFYTNSIYDKIDQYNQPYSNMGWSKPNISLLHKQDLLTTYILMICHLLYLYRLWALTKTTSV